MWTKVERLPQLYSFQEFRALPGRLCPRQGGPAAPGWLRTSFLVSVLQAQFNELTESLELSGKSPRERDGFRQDVANRGGDGRFRPTAHYSAAITACDFAQPTGDRGGIPGYRYLREAALQPHKKRYWLNTTEKDPVQFQKQVEAVCDTYLEAPALEQNRRTHTVSSDEMTGLQALERNAPSRPMTSGQCEKIGFEYTRHGALTLIGNFQVTTGELIAPRLGSEESGTNAPFGPGACATNLRFACPFGSWPNGGR